MIKRNINDTVYIDGMTSMAQQNARRAQITDINYKYNEDTGEQFQICLVEGDWYYSDDGSPYSNKRSMYYIEF